MRISTLRWAYTLLALLEISLEWYAAQTNNLLGVWLTKPLMMPILLLLVITWKRIKLTQGRWIMWLQLALLFSWVGDVLLMLKILNTELFFLLGLGAFLLAHIAYILSFQSSLKPATPTPLQRHSGLLVLLVGYGMSMLAYLFQNGGTDFQPMKLPVLAYTLVIMTMLAMAYQRQGRVSQRSFTWVLTGAILFAISDSIIALNSFTALFTGNDALASILIMTLYLGGQYYLVNGLLEDENSQVVLYSD